MPGEVTQAILASKTSGEFSRSAIANIETGRHRVAIHQIYILAEALACGVEELMPAYDLPKGTSNMTHGALANDPQAADLIARLAGEPREGFLAMRKEKR